jgi:hypothetical protein
VTTKKILILQRGWVAVGDYSESGDEVMLQEASIVRRWGTTTGLGELASKGPRPKTILDQAGTVRVHKLGVVLAIDCNEKAWAR